MEKEEFRAYVLEHKRIGLDNGQIAAKLGMTPGIFEDACKFAFEDDGPAPVPPKVPSKPAIDAVAQKPRKEKVPGVYYVPQGDEETFPESPIVEKIEKKKKTEKTESAS